MPIPSEEKLISVLNQTLLRAQFTFGRVDLTQSNEQPAQVESRGTVTFSDDSMPMTETTISGIGSITKQFTAATLIKLWDEDLTKSKASDAEVSEIFPEGIDTKFANFMPALRERFTQSSRQFDRIEHNESYPKVTLRDLLSHTHGLGERDNKESLRLLRATQDRPLELHEIINVTTEYHLDGDGNPNPTRPHKHGEFCYSNFGCDMTAMIIECITNQPFDEVVRGKILEPHGLNSTHPQSDHIELYASNQNVARGYMIDHNAFRSEEDKIANPAEFPELNFNTKSNTRAAGGFKSSVGDLAKFARLYMNAEMFKNVEVVRTVKDYDRGAEMAKGHPDKYHLAIQSGLIGGAVGHTGDDNDFFSNLRFFPETGEVKAELLVVENATRYVANKVFAKTHPGQKEIVDHFVHIKFREEFKNNGFPEEGSEQFNELARSFLNNPANQSERKIFEEYCSVIERIAAIPREDLRDGNRREAIITSLASKQKAKEFEDIGNASNEDNGNPSKKSWVKKISDKKRAKDDSEITR